MARQGKGFFGGLFEDQATKGRSHVWDHPFVMLACPPILPKDPTYEEATADQQDTRA